MRTKSPQVDANGWFVAELLRFGPPCQKCGKRVKKLKWKAVAVDAPVRIKTEIRCVEC